MAISVVNGYLCMNGCDAAKARTGQNPQAPTTPAQSTSDTNNKANDATNAAAVVYGGILASLNNGTVLNPSVSTANTSPAQSINVLA